MNNNSLRVDILVGVLGIAVSLAIFFAQGGGGSVLANLLAVSPVALAVLAIAIHRLVLRIKRLRAALDLVLSARTHATLVIKVKNADGDVGLEKIFRIEAMGTGAVLSMTKNEVLCSEVPVPNVPPDAKVESASMPGTRLQARYFDQSEVVVAGKKNHKYEWRYEIVPPIRESKQFVQFSYRVDIPKCEASAFTEEGGAVFYDHSAFETEAEVSLFSPDGYRIMILNTYVERFDGSQAHCESPPVLGAGGHSLQWRPAYQRRARSVCCYRLVPSGGA